MGEKLKLLGISGSPRRGNSLFLLERALKAAREDSGIDIETEAYSLVGKKFEPCKGCTKCQIDCIYDDHFLELREKWYRADSIIYSIPIYHMGIPGQLKCFIDRLGNNLWATTGGRPRKGMKTIGTIVQGAHISAGQEFCISFMMNHALVLGCLPVTGDPWEAYIGAGGWTLNSGDKDFLEKEVQREGYDAEVLINATESTAIRAVQIAYLLKQGALHSKDFMDRNPEFHLLLDRE